jgi:hypothetical protein
MDAFRFLSATQGAEWDCRNSGRELPIAEWKKSRRRRFSVAIGNQATPCIEAHPSLFTHLDVRVSCNNLCHMASTLSVVSCRICQAHSLLRHTHTHIAMHIDYDRLCAFGYHLLNTGVYVVQTHYVKLGINEIHTARPDFAFIHLSELVLEIFTVKSFFQLRFKILYFQ